MPQHTHLLIVEDQAFDAVLLRQLLDRSSLAIGRVDLAGSLAEASDLLSKHFYDAVLLDLGLPDADGVELVQALSARFPHVAIVVLTGREGRSIGLDAMRAGAQDKLTKTELDPDSLARSLQYAIARQQLEAERRQSAEEHRVLFRDHPHPWMVCDRNTLHILDANAAVVRQYGYRIEALIGKALPEIVPPAYRQALLDVLRAAGFADCVQHECQIVTHGGNTLDVALTIQSLARGGRPTLMIMARDVTLQRRAIHALELSEHRFRRLFQYSLGLICTHDMEGLLLSVNPAAAKALGYEVGDLLGRLFTDFMPERLHQGFADYLRRIALAREDSGAFRLIGADGRTRVWEYHNVLDHDSDGQPYVVGHGLDITERLQHERQLQEQTVRDPLTGCFNRRALPTLERQFTPAQRWCTIVIDLDGFKHINDTRGHAQGDQVLASMGQFLRDHTGDLGAVIRTGGDEFLVVTHEAGSAAMSLVARLETASADAPTPFTIGAACREEAESLSESIRRADDALYRRRRDLSASAPSVAAPR